MRILILGGAGMLGHKLLQHLSTELDVFATIRDDGQSLIERSIAESNQLYTFIDVNDIAAIEKVIVDVAPLAVINAVGVIKQLPASSEVINTLQVNSILPHRLKELSDRMGFRLVQISTDCVYQGTKGNYSETDPSDALDLYGRSKNLGEVSSGNSITLRTSIIGRELSTSHSLIEWFLSNRGGRVNGYVNAIYSGFPTIVFADIIKNLLLHHGDLTGVFNVSSEAIDKFELLNLVNEAFEAAVTIDRDEDFYIDRSLDSTLFRELTGFVPQSWDSMIELMASDPTPYDQWRK